MNFVDEENLAVLDRAEDAGEIELLLQHRAGGLLKADFQFLRDDGRERGFAQARRAVKQHVIHGLAAFARRVDGDLQILFEPGLAGEIGQAARAQTGFELALLFVPGCRDETCYLQPSAHQLQGLAEQRFEVIGDRPPRALCGPQLRPRDARSPDSAAPKEHLHPVAKARARSGRFVSGRRGQLVAQFQHHAFGRLLANAGNAHQPVELIAPDGGQQIRRGHPAQNLNRQPGPDTADADQLFEQVFLVRE